MIITNMELVKHYIVVLVRIIDSRHEVPIYQQMLILITPVFISVLLYLGT